MSNGSLANISWDIKQQYKQGSGCLEAYTLEHIIYTHIYQQIYVYEESEDGDREKY